MEQVAGDIESATVHADVLAEQKDTRIALHLLPQSFADRLGIRKLAGCCHSFEF